MALMWFAGVALLDRKKRPVDNVSAVLVVDDALDFEHRKGLERKRKSHLADGHELVIWRAVHVDLPRKTKRIDGPIVSDAPGLRLAEIGLIRAHNRTLHGQR